MPNITYNLDIPDATHNPSSDQPLMEVNTNAIAQIVNQDLYGFGNNNGGLHQQVTLPASNIPPGPPFTPTIFTKNDVFSVPQLFFYTGTAAQSSNQYVASTNGSTLLFGGIILKWGQGTIATGGPGSNVNFSVAFPNQCLCVVVTGRNAGNNTGGYNVNALSAAFFNLFASSNGNFNYFAIGN